MSFQTVWAHRLPIGLRLWVARLIIRVRKHSSMPARGVRSAVPLWFCLTLALAGLFGFLLGQNSAGLSVPGYSLAGSADLQSGHEGGSVSGLVRRHTDEFPELTVVDANFNSGSSAARPDADTRLPSAARPWPANAHPMEPSIPAGFAALAELRADVLQLEAMFITLAEILNIDDGEFTLDDRVPDLPALNGADEVTPGAVLGSADLLNRHVAHMSVELDRLNRLAVTRSIHHNQILSGRPIDEGALSSRFGYRLDPISGKRHMHRGVDFAAPEGTPIRALADGVVAFASQTPGYGWMVEIEHADGLRSRYAHNRENRVKPGQPVRKGQVVALLGSSGRSTGPHVHVEIRQHGAPLDPLLFVR